MPKYAGGAGLPNRSYQKGYRFENERRKFWQGFFGSFGEGCKRSPMSRGADITFFDYLLRKWTVSCKVKKVPKWMLDEVEAHDILDIHVDHVGDFSFLPTAKLEELLTRAMSGSQYELTNKAIEFCGGEKLE